MVDWMMVWLSKQPAWADARDVEISTRTFGLNTTAFMVPGEEEENKLSGLTARKISYLPAPASTYSMWYHRRYVTITRIQTQTGRRNRKEETLKISILARHHRVLNELLLEAKKEYTAAQEDTIAIHVADTSNCWNQVASRPKRHIDSIILDPGVSELLVNDARDFLQSKAWYAARGIPFRRGYLLYGVPGSGKTSIISSIAGELGLDIYILSLSRSRLDDSALMELISDLPEKCITLMEDIDAAFTHTLNRDAEDAKTSPPGAPQTATGGLSLSGLLNALDGVAAQEGRLLYATTNKYAALDPALCRPGRMDIHVEFKLASKYQAERMFSSFYLPPEEEAATKEDEEDENKDSDDTDPPNVVAGADPDKLLLFGTSHTRRAPKLSRRQVASLAARFAEAIPEREVSMAALQGFLMTYKIRPYEAVTAARSWVQAERELRMAQTRSVTRNLPALDSTATAVGDLKQEPT